MINLDSILKNRDITLLTKVRLVKAMIFPVVMYGCQSWTIKKVECWGIDAFELWFCRRHHSYGRKWRGTKESLDESERGTWKSLKLNIQKSKIMAFSPIISWQIDLETMETVRDLSSLISVGKNLPAMQETLVWFLCWDDLLEKG